MLSVSDLSRSPATVAVTAAEELIEEVLHIAIRIAALLGRALALLGL